MHRFSSSSLAVTTAGSGFCDLPALISLRGPLVPLRHLPPMPTVHQLAILVPTCLPLHKLKPSGVIVSVGLPLDTLNPLAAVVPVGLSQDTRYQGPYLFLRAYSPTH